MDFKSELAGRYLRIIAIIALLLGLADASRLLGVSSGSVSPIAQLGPTGFAFLTVFCLARLFAAVGLWIRASWGAVLLVGATLLKPKARRDLADALVRLSRSLRMSLSRNRYPLSGDMRRVTDDSGYNFLTCGYLS
ncbi:MAG: hypothetical protein K0Q69_4243 [Devosia sp.]|nr:hypothetical protein [Devosia sp.]